MLFFFFLSGVETTKCKTAWIRGEENYGTAKAGGGAQIRAHAASEMLCVVRRSAAQRYSDMLHVRRGGNAARRRAVQRTARVQRKQVRRPNRALRVTVHSRGGGRRHTLAAEKKVEPYAAAKENP